MTERIEYWLHKLSQETTMGMDEQITVKERKELLEILTKLYEDNKMIYGSEGEYVRND